jgi:hypothetical protein
MDRKSAVLALAAAAAAGVIIGVATIWVTKRESDSADGTSPDDVAAPNDGPASDAAVGTTPSTTVVAILAEAAANDRSAQVAGATTARSPPAEVSSVTRHLPSAAPRDPVQVKKLLRQFLDAGEEGMLEQALRGAQQHSAYKALQDVSIRIGVLQELCACAQLTSHVLLAQTLTVLANYASNGASRP